MEDTDRDFADDILEATSNEPIEAIVLGDFGHRNDYGHDTTRRITEDKVGILLSWDEARELPMRRWLRRGRLPTPGRRAGSSTCWSTTAPHRLSRFPETPWLLIRR